MQETAAAALDSVRESRSAQYYDWRYPMAVQPAPFGYGYGPYQPVYEPVAHYPIQGSQSSSVFRNGDALSALSVLSSYEPQLRSGFFFGLLSITTSTVTTTTSTTTVTVTSTSTSTSSSSCSGGTYATCASG